MDGHIVALKDSVHDEVQRLLPWFVVDTLTGSELELVNQHLNVCDECQADFTWQCKLQATPPAVDANVDVDRAYSNILQQLDEASRKVNRPNLARLPDHAPARIRRWMQWVLAVQFAAIAGFAILVATPYGNVAAYRALGASPNSSGNVVVVFRPETSERELRRILHDAGARIVDGPTVTDAYLLAVPEEKISAVLQDLRADRAVIVAESLRSAGRP
jgi:hypothetical protein